MCTSLLMTATDGSHLFSRTMDWHTEASRPIFLPRHYAWQSLYNGKSHVGPYAVLGVGGPHRYHEDVSDGINEMGLSVQKLTYQNAAIYNDERQDDETQIAPFEFVLWALTHCRSVADLINQLPQIQLMTSKEADVTYAQGPHELHFVATDATGRFIVIEPNGMPMTVINNPLNVTTNAVDFEREVERLKEYFPLKVDRWQNLPFNQNRVTDGKFSGLKKEPSGFTPTARFIRTMVNKERLDAFNDEQENMIASWHVLNNVTVPAQHTRSDTYTVYRSAVGLESKVMYFQGYSDTRIYRIEFPVDYENMQEVVVFNQRSEPVFDQMLAN